MDNLTLEHLSAYLPYELKMIFEGTGGRIITLMGINNQGKYGVTITGGEGAMFLNTCRFKPLLRPLSQLTQEIEHNGETFVPMVELYKIARGRYKDSVVKYWSVMSTTSIQVEQEGFNNFFFSLVNSDCDVRLKDGLNFQLHSTNLYYDNPKTIMVQCWNLLFQKLHEWHFDLYNLLDRGLAVAIESEGNNERNKI